jgi:heptosyltransferase-3
MDFGKGIKKIILFRTDRLGDLVLSFPVVEALKASLPKAQIDLCVNPCTAPLARLHRHVFQAIPDTVRGPKSFFGLVRFLKTQRYDLAIHLYPRPHLALATLWARVPLRVGTLYRYYSFSFNRRVQMHRKTMSMHETDSNLKLIETLGVSATQISNGLLIPEKALQAIHDLLSSKGIHPLNRRFAVLHPGSGGSSLNWPPEHYGTLGRELARRGFPVVLTGTEIDRSVVNQVRLHAGGNVTDLCGELDLEQLTALLSEASLLVSNSTGPLHLADALGKKVIGLYSPFLFSSPIRWGPYQQPENVFLPPRETCPKCVKDRCDAYNCMGSILPQTVLERALEILSSEP